MSSPKTRPVPPAAGQALDTAAVEDASLSVEASRLAAALEKDLAAGRHDLLTPQALQALMAASCKAYAARVEAGEDILPFGARGGVSPTDVMVTASGLLRAVNLAVFELGMWQSWTGR
ncbi:MAG: hypothetical protein IT536_12815 [Hyphomicrobiales bacterium]|nr:hypothetical protein [Hyphomicrobiales bacterium]